MNQEYNRSSVQKFYGLSTDNKPTDCESGSRFVEIDTAKEYIFNKNGSSWTEIPTSGGGSQQDIPEPMTAAEIEYLWNLEEIAVYDIDNGSVAYISSLDQLEVYLEEHRYDDTFYNVVIGDTVVGEISSRMFAGNSRIKRVELGRSITKIASGAFVNCSNLHSVFIRGRITDVPSGCFSSCSNLRICVLPNTITSIKSGAFSNAYSIESFTFPKSLKTIESGAFSGVNLIHIELNDGLETIGSYAFSNVSFMSKTQTITIGTGMITIDSSAFSGLQNVSKIYVYMEQGSVSGAPWGATYNDGVSETTVEWLGER